ncbi:MAG: 2,3-bisphosphoglycerate-independent phosphoglycerate mutase, partial [Parcubacteria group bacterium]|nr:2,3-bisphosphoglycerate-independent phosphoglycerate mutase [Parcubacteria group bacterium]
MFFNKKKEEVLSPKVVLVILDGWGKGKNDLSNPLAEAHLPTIQYLEENYPSGSLQASGIAIGLPLGEVGNSE